MLLRCCRSELANTWRLALLLLGTSCAWAEDHDDSPYQPGLIATLTLADDHTLVRIDRQVALSRLDAGSDLSPPAVNPRVVWRGWLLVQTDGSYQLAAYARGQVTIRCQAATILSATAEAPQWLTARAVALPFGWHELEVELQDGGPESQLALYWSGPDFGLEPLGAAHLFHDSSAAVDDAWERGAELARALRCEACHRGPQPSLDLLLPAPALDRPSGQLYGGWLSTWLQAAPGSGGQDPATAAAGSLGRRMPYFGLSADQAAALAAYLAPAPYTPAVQDNPLLPEDIEAGRKLFVTIGCLACHGYEGLSPIGLFHGGDLSRTAEKRPPDFFARWLAAPEQVNGRHRMPAFALTVPERGQLAAFLGSLGSPVQPLPPAGAAAELRGRRLYHELRCAACHGAGPGESDRDASNMSPVKPLAAQSDWARSCAAPLTAAERRPGYGLRTEDQRALRAYFSRHPAATLAAHASHRRLLAEQNCLACHAREEAVGFVSRAPGLLESFPELASSLAALIPPSLNSVGDKLRDEALLAAIRRDGPPRRPWLLVRMPRYAFRRNEAARLAETLIAADRIPAGGPAHDALPDVPVPVNLGARLVTPDGFGCTSCHTVGVVKAPNGPLHTLGPDLLLLGQRIRPAWFRRWLRSPARIVPRMEMPSVQTAVPGVLDENLEVQLAAVWHTLNRPDFRPPQPNPVRVVRRRGDPAANERAAVLTDVLRCEQRVLVKPLLVGLPNRHSLLFDLERAAVGGWWLGDVARQRTEGKSWYWEAGGVNLLGSALDQAEIRLFRGDTSQPPELAGQFLTEFDDVRHVPGGVEFRYRLHFGVDSSPVQVFARERWTAISAEHVSGVRREVEVSGLPANARIAFCVLPASRAADCRRSEDHRQLWFPEHEGTGVTLLAPQQAGISPAGEVLAAAEGGHCRLELVYRTSLPVDRFLAPAESRATRPSERLFVVPGFDAVRLPVSHEIMPTGLAWNADGDLLFTSLKGQVWRARDTDGDGLEDAAWPISDELAAPYGLAAGDGWIDVITKYALLRLFDDDGDMLIDRMQTVASGWGHTADYHDWVVGLPRTEGGDYYIGLPCQQDERSQAAARYRGQVVRLTARAPTDDDPRSFALHPVSAGHRFPMGLALGVGGQVFATDNQGNYNPFNELNHVRAGAHFGFVNSGERVAGVTPPPLTAPAINIPHPWTRSVNGICFLGSGAAASHAPTDFGPFQGQLIGCEYDLRRLVRMSLQQVGDTFQGAVYPFSLDTPAQGPSFLGPLVCGVSPQGDLYIGSLRDSGWGGANNIGELVRLRPRFGELPVGIAEVRAVAGGFEFEFTRPTDVERAGDVRNYVVASYRRIATPDYGGPDVERRVERPQSAEVSADGRRVRLRFHELRRGFVYEFHVRNLSSDPGQLFFPAEAHYTLHAVPDER